MLLINKINFEDIRIYRKDYTNSLSKNIQNIYINKIIVFLDAIDNNLPKSEKVIYLVKKNYTNVQLVEYAKKISKEEVIIWTEKPHIFNNELFKYKFGEELKSENFIIFNRNNTNLNIIPEKNKSIVIKNSIKNEKIPELKKEINLNKNNIVNSNSEITAIIVSINYNEYLSITLPNNKNIINNIIVATVKEDEECIRICNENNTSYILVDNIDIDSINKSKCINHAINSIKNPNYILIMDADIIISKEINVKELKDDVLYTSGRHIVENFAEYKLWLENEYNNNIKYEKDRGLGFFQLFNWKKVKKYPNSENGRFSENSWSDIIFKKYFEKRESINAGVLHIGKAYQKWPNNNKFLPDNYKKKYNKIINKSIITEGVINSYFDKIYCLNLDRREDKWLKIKKYFDRHSIKVERFSGIDGKEIDKSIRDEYSLSDGAIGCLLSHYKIIEDAKLKRYKKILIFEDDIMLSDNIITEFEEKIKNIKNWKLLYLGSSQYNWNVEYIDGFYYSRNSLGTFAYAIDISIYDDILKTKDIKNTPIDNIIAKIQEDYYKDCYTFFPYLAIADVSDSDIRNGREQNEHSKKMKWNQTKVTKTPFFSVIIPTFNSKMLSQTIESINNQTYKDYEIIIVDDGSDINYHNIDIKVHKRPNYMNKNANSCRNYGALISRGDYLVFLDSDDILTPNCLEDRKNKILESPNYDNYIFNMGRFNKTIGDITNIVNKKQRTNSLLNDFLSYNIIWPTTSSTWKREVFFEIGGWNEKLNRLQDFDIHIRYLLYNKKTLMYPHNNIDCYYRTSEFHKTMDNKKRIIVKSSAEKLIDEYRNNGIEFHDGFYNHLRKYNFL